MNRPANARGFTLIELMVTVVIIGLVTIFVAPLVGEMLSAINRSYAESAKQDNQRIVDAMLLVAKNQGVGKLPAPYSGDGYSNAVMKLSGAGVIDVAFKQYLSETGIAPNAVNDDGTTAQNVRVYQRISGITQSTPLYFRSGPLVTLTYDYGVVYLTACPLVGSSCNPSSTGVPGASPRLTVGNRDVWATTQPDTAARFVSTLPVQTAMLTSTTRRVDRVRDAFLSFYRGKQLTAAATDSTNWYPGTGRSGGAPTSNQGCRDGWYPLDSTDLLNLVGLAPEEFGVTSWGGRIEFCRDFDPAASKGANAPPHAAAVRFRADVSAGLPPDPTAIANNVILTL